ncbi:hypothetical protein C8Q79DRAFT_1007517 [Trametes meyenii]|nr:hypothetical protein C8Q79DRAFT_1007517 [Trametes meyenii]
MALVTEVMVGNLLNMSEEAVQVYEEAALRYLCTAKELYDISITPNQHNSLHIPLFLHLFGPLHPIRTFFSERMNYLLQQTNTNMHFGELESTYMKHTCRAANLRALLKDDSVRPQVEELVDALDDARAEDRRGTRMRESFLGPGRGPRKPVARKQVTLGDTCFGTLVKYLNQKEGQEKYVDIQRLRRIPGLQQLSNCAFHCRSVFCGGTTMLSSSNSPKDSNIIFRSPHSSSSSESAGRIQQIFTYHIRDQRGDFVESTYIFVAPLKELSSSDTERDPYRRYPYVGGRLCYDAYLPGIIIAKADIVSHFARTVVDLRPDITDACIHILPLDKTVRLLSQRPTGESEERPTDETLDLGLDRGLMGVDEHVDLGLL